MIVQSVSGVIYGRTVLLDADPGLPQGDFVEVTMRSKEQPGSSKTTPTLAGALASLPAEVDAELEEILRERHRTSRRDSSEP